MSTLFLAWYTLSVSTLVYFFVRTKLSNPGLVRAKHWATGGADRVEGQAEGQAELIRGLAIKGDLHASLICSTCLIEKPSRSKHCSTCGYCVHRFDHHCPFVGTCVGRDNIGYFMGFVTFCSLAIGSHLAVALPFIWRTCPMKDSIVDTVICDLANTPKALLVITGLAVVHEIWITLLGFAQLGQIFSDITTYEAIRGDHPKPVSCSRGCANVADVLRGRPTHEDRDSRKPTRAV
jgi:hypothetical protein